MPSNRPDLLPETARALRHRLATAQVSARAPSVVAAVVRDGGPVWVEGWGDVDGVTPGGDVQYRIGSITKTFVTVLVLRLRDEGRLALTDRLDEHLPGTAIGDATIGALLAHTAGLAAEPPGPWWERSPGSLRPSPADVLPDDPRVFTPGDRFHYSNPGFAVLGALVERLRGEEWTAVLAREILEPLGMTRTGVRPSAPHASGYAVHPWADVLLPEPVQDYGPMGPAGELWSTADDLCRFAVFLLDGDERVLGAESRALLRFPSSAPEATVWHSSYGLGTQLLRRGDRLLSGHTGSVPGFVATVWVSPDDGLGAVLLANTTAGLPAGTVTADLLDVVAEREPRIPAPWTPLAEVDPAVLDLAGPWYWGPAPHVLRPTADGGLDLGPLTSGGGRGARFRPAGDGAWVGLNGYFAGERLTVQRDPQGVVTHLDVGTFVFTRHPYDPAAPIPGGLDGSSWQAAPSKEA
ncbi:serine hydrolase [Paractinoplanes abujensis]|uniref:CubicO group peptidase (Beta-lactamase class C family) n=1 Tax=Paractinoplanes abujensis TaxID=882441 RepID=A0A7W7CP66_9ACTN|nr:serine hydrolase domain-containing protein [Actinoplanes abujensis]MBB4692172.1 CubicO group peptidase (beta-lactamase class C family) [Actinoplanes abujensis]GID16413.1 serine hydrolase [Actinoplanes abujensis]